MAVEVREADLRCTDTEAVEVMGAAGARVRTADVAALNRRLGGWMGGVALAARAAREAPDPALAAAAVSDGAASMQEYLLQQALDSRPHREREFLLLASVVDVLVPGLAQRVAGPDAEDLAAQLAASHLFLEPLPRPGSGWRMQPMLRDLLRAHLALEDPTTWERANRRAAGWYRDRGRTETATDHLVQASAWTEAADLLVESGQAVLIVTGEADDSVVAATSRLPSDLPGSGAHLVRAALALARDAEAEAAAELSLVGTAGRATSSVFAATAAALRAWSAARLADLAEAEAAVTEGTTVVRRLSAPDGSGLAALRGLTGLAEGYLHLRCGRWENARLVLVDVADEAPENAVRVRTMALGLTALASALSGRLTDAGIAAARAVSLLEEAGIPANRRCPAPYLALSYVALERGDLLAARRHRDQAQEAPHAATGPVEHAAHALIRAGVLPVDAAPHDLSRLQEAASQVTTSPPLADLLRLDAAWSALPEEPRRATAELGSLHDAERPPALVARAAALRRSDPTTAASLIRQAEQSPHDLRTEVQRLLTDADLQLAEGPSACGRSHLDAALGLAAPERLRRPFLHVSEQARRLLRTDTTLRVRHPWLVTTHPKDPAGPIAGGGVPAQRAGPTGGLAAPTSSGRRQGTAGLVEPLTAKEMEVLAHLNHLLDTEEIAEAMVVSVNTVRTHVRHVLRKLGVDRRNAAVRRAWELGLLQGPDTR
jgi:LuxR family maltose regulon positive regulatory protein